MRMLTLTLAVLVAGAASADEKKMVENPEFAAWAKLKPGAAVVLKTTSDALGIKETMTLTNTLLEVKDDVAIVETTGVADLLGKQVKTPSKKREIKKMVEVKPGEHVPGTKPEGATEEGTETLKVGNAEVKTKWYKYKTKTPVGDVEGQIWTSDEVPGLMVKMTTKASKLSSTTELVEIKK